MIGIARDEPRVNGRVALLHISTRQPFEHAEVAFAQPRVGDDRVTGDFRDALCREVRPRQVTGIQCRECHRL